MSLAVNLITVSVLLVFAAVLKLAEASLGAVSESELSPLVQNKNKQAIRVSKLTSDKLPFTSALKTALSVTEFFCAAITAISFTEKIATPLISKGMPTDAAFLLGAFAVTLVFTLITVIVISIIMRHIAIKHSFKISLAISGFALFVSRLFYPLSAFISAFAGGFLILLGINRHEQESDVSEEAIKMLVDAGSEMGTINSDEKEFIENVFAFDDLSVDEIATHRTGITILWTDETAEEWETTVLKSRHTYFPVCDGKIDNVIGVLNSKEYLRLSDRSMENVMKNAVKTPFFVPVSMKANVLLKEMKRKREFFAVVIDEYGGLGGIITVADLLQCIVGEIFEDEDAPKLPEIERLDSKVWKIMGSAPIDDVSEALGVSLDGDYDTFAGYVLTMVESIPDDGVVFTVENDVMTVRVTAIKDRRIQKTMVQLKERKED